MSTIPPPPADYTLDEYTRSTQLQQNAEQLRQQQIAQQQRNAVEQGQLANQTAAQTNQNQLAPEVLKQQQIENQQRQLALQQQQAALGAQKKNLKKDDSGKIIGFDNEGYQRDALAAGVPLPTITAQQQAITEAATKAAALTSDQLKNHETELDQHFQSIEGLRKIPAGPQREQAYQLIVNKAGMKGDDISQYPTQIGDDANVDQIEAHLGMTKQALNQAKEQSEINKNNQTTSAARLESNYLQLHQQKLLSQQKGPDGQPLAPPLTPEQNAAHDSYEHNKKDLSPTLNPILLGFKARAADNADANTDRKDIDFIDKNYVKPANDKEQSYQMFQDAYNNRNNAKTGAESMLALSTHLATTFGNVKGARVTKDMIQEHLGARGISDSALVAVQKLTNGDVLSPDQWDAFKGLISNARNLNWQTAQKEAKRRNVDISGSLPADLAGSSNTAPADFFSNFGGKKR